MLGGKKISPFANYYNGNCRHKRLSLGEVMNWLIYAKDRGQQDPDRFTDGKAPDKDYLPAASCSSNCASPCIPTSFLVIG